MLIKTEISLLPRNFRRDYFRQLSPITGSTACITEVEFTRRFHQFTIALILAVLGEGCQALRTATFRALFSFLARAFKLVFFKILKRCQLSLSFKRIVRFG